MPWDGTELWVGDLAGDGTVTGERRVAGGADESIFQPAWSPSGELHFVSDRTGWWNLYRERDGRSEALKPDVERSSAGRPGGSAASMYAFLGDGRIVCEYGPKGSSTSRSSTPGPASCSTSTFRTPRSGGRSWWRRARTSRSSRAPLDCRTPS